VTAPSPIEVVVVRTGSANLASVVAAFTRLGAIVRLSDEAGEIDTARRVVLPGVGAFAAAMDQLRGRELVRPLLSRVEQGRPILSICLGMQLLAQTSEESPGVAGVGAISGHVRRFGGGVRVPQLGWNTVEVQPGCRVLQSGFAYFANSYCLDEIPEGWSGATADHGGSFVAGIERGCVLACQFHPELSGDWGLALLRRWLTSEDPC
jgi:glutamine amidotransferase